MRLADLLRDLEQRRRDDVTLLFVRTSQLQAGSLVEKQIARCSEIFRTESVILEPDTPERQARWGDLGKWPVGCNVLWQGTTEHFMTKMDASTIFMVDGGDSVPLCRDWIDVLVADQAETVRQGKQVTGWVGKDGLGRWHANLNCIYERSFFEQHPVMLEMPAGADYYEPVDMLRRETILSACRASSAIYNSWRFMGAHGGHFAQLSAKSAWWHGCKDGDLVDKARAFIYSRFPGAPPLVVDQGPALELSRQEES